MSFKKFTTLTVVLVALLAITVWAATQQQPWLFVGGITVGATGDKITSVLSETATLDFASAAANVCSANLTVAVTGAALGDVCAVGVPTASVNQGSIYNCVVSATNTVQVRHCNNSAGANDPESGTFRVTLIKF